jgi:hypothetical protein
MNPATVIVCPRIGMRNSDRFATKRVVSGGRRPSTQMSTTER